VRLRPATPADIGFVLETEADPDAAPYIRAATRADHEAAIADASRALLVIVLDDERLAGFVLLAGIGDSNVELRRIVVRERGRGIGRRAVALVLEHAFGTLGAHRVWLDVMTHNERARRAYAAAGFVHEGIQREALRRGDRYESLALMSVLAPEFYASGKATERT
jgi:RimJ/RimL family protein N-acetyltransferase